MVGEGSPSCAPFADVESTPLSLISAQLEDHMNSLNPLNPPARRLGPGAAGYALYRPKVGLETEQRSSEGETIPIHWQELSEGDCCELPPVLGQPSS
jgi:hypothetical protein